MELRFEPDSLHTKHRLFFILRIPSPGNLVAISVPDGKVTSSSGLLVSSLWGEEGGTQGQKPGPLDLTEHDKAQT